MKELELYNRWKAADLEDDDLILELENIQDNKDEIYERFYTSLNFGTAGLRGIIGAGTNRMNIYTVRQATQGFSEYLLEMSPKPKVAIAYDSRIKSQLFASQSACVFAANGIKVFLYPMLMPTPALSFAVRELGCDGGVVITASHNPAKYNGYKAYDNTGCQIGPEAAEAIFGKITKTDIFDDIKFKSFDRCLNDGSVELISSDFCRRYTDRVLQEQIRPGITKNSGLKLVYTPLNGAGRNCVLEVLDRIGMTDVSVVKEQEMPDGNFPTCPYPNPESREALELGLQLCDKIGADLLIATDPDCDRVGAAVKTPEGHRLITGNEMGVLMLEYICSSRKELGKMPENPITIRTIVTTSMVDDIAAEYGVEVKQILTGFKYIGEWIRLLEEKGEQNRFILGFEESYGYLTGSYVRDKDAVNGAMIICEMAAYYKRKGRSLANALEDLYKKYGYYKNHVESLTFEGADGMKKMSSIMDKLRSNPPQAIGSCKIDYAADYEKGVVLRDGKEIPTGLPQSNVLEYGLTGLGTLIVRPSGTEPKLKIYYSVKAKTMEMSDKLCSELAAAIKPILGV